MALTPKQAAADEVLTEHPRWPAKTIARVCIRRYPELWGGCQDPLQAARQTVLQRLGLHKNRPPQTDEFTREPRPSGVDWRQYMPEPISEYDEPWGPVKFSGPMKVLGLFDVHIPFHDRKALEIAIDHGIAWGADCVLIGGDWADFYSVSFWEKDPRLRMMSAERSEVIRSLEMLREAFPSATMIYKEGNHEERLMRWASKKTSEDLIALYGIDYFDWDKALELNRLRITRIGDKRPIRIGELNILHGHEYRMMSSPVNPARTAFLKSLSCVVVGDKHQTSQHSQPTLDGKLISTWSVGCLCQLHPRYMPLNNWNHGYILIEVDESGAFQVDNRRILHDKSWK